MGDENETLGHKAFIDWMNPKQFSESKALTDENKIATYEKVIKKLSDYHVACDELGKQLSEEIKKILLGKDESD